MSRKSTLRRPVGAPKVAAARPALSLDPTDWPSYRREAHKALDAALDHVEQAGARPVWTPVPDTIKQAIDLPAPWSGQGLGPTLEEARRLVLPYTVGNTHPRFFGWVHGSGTAGGVVAEMLAAAMNVNAGGREHAAVYVERQVIEWAKEILGFPAAASGLLVSGTSMATLIALTAARDNAGSADSRRTGLSARRLVGYASSEAHSCIAKTFEILGLGRDALRLVPVDAAYRMDVSALKHLIAEDKTAGYEPFVIIATAGTVNTGATDPIAAIARIARTQKLWLHVDGAFGALARLSPETRHIVTGIDKAHSVAFDFHKWLHVPYDAGAVLIRDGAKLRRSFASRPDYLKGAERGLAAGEPWFCELGPELSRGFRAFKVWFTLKEHGLERLGEKIADNCRQAQHLAKIVNSHPELELLAPVSLNIVCFRFRAAEAADLDTLNGDIVVALQEKGIAAPSTTRIAGKLAIRVNLTNHRTTFEDLDQLVDAILAEARERTKARSLARPAGTGKPRLRPASKVAAVRPSARRQGPILVAPEQRATLAAALREPDLQPLIANLDLRIGDAGELPFVASAEEITISPRALENPAAIRILLRHAAEIALWHRLTNDQPGLAWQAALALAACRVTASYMATLPEAIRQDATTSMPAWLVAAYGATATPDRFGKLDMLLGRSAVDLDKLLQLQGLEQADIEAIAASPVLRSEAVNLLAGLGEVMLSTEAMILAGGDPRIALDPRTGTNGYGAAPRPIAGEISFASSTASSMTAAGFASAETLRQRLTTDAIDGRLAAGYRREADAIRREIGRYLGLERVPGAEIVLSASGTDTTFAALALARGSDPVPIVSLFLSPEETGSGIPKAAAGCHFLGVTSLGHAVGPGAAIEGLGGPGVSAEWIALRRPSGALRRLDEIEAEIEARVATIIAKGHRCLLHVLDAAKTGAGAPSPALIARLQARHGSELAIVVDACQLRLSPEAMRAMLGRGQMLQITGSKFFTGPPFSGALIVPADIARAAANRAALPAGLGLYSGQSEWPAALAGPASSLPQTCNLGILARWRAALAEIDLFRSVPSSDADTVLARFAAEMTAAIANRPELTPVEAPVLDRATLAATDDWSRTPTILAFTLATTRHGRRRTLSMDELKRVHRWLLSDLSAVLPVTPSAREQRAAAARCHLGQPVKIATEGARTIGALRLCSSARVVTAATFDHDLGATPTERLAAILDDARLTLDKAALIARHFDVLARSLAI